MKKYILPVFILLLGLTVTNKVIANLYEFAVAVDMFDPQVEEGHIISFEDGKYILSTQAYDGRMVGVVTTNPTLYLQNIDSPSSVLVANGGEVKVRVSSSNGAIKIGDFITSSESPGIGQKADKGGYVLGVALDEYDSGDKNQIGIIGILIDLKSNFDPDPLTRNLLSTISSAFSAPFRTPLASLRYIIALMITAFTFIFAFVYFGRISNRGVEALGRNPLAKSSIRRIILFNFLMTFIIIVAGLGISYLILIL